MSYEKSYQQTSHQSVDNLRVFSNVNPSSVNLVDRPLVEGASPGDLVEEMSECGLIGCWRQGAVKYHFPCEPCFPDEDRGI